MSDKFNSVVFTIPSMPNVSLIYCVRKEGKILLLTQGYSLFKEYPQHI